MLFSLIHTEIGSSSQNKLLAFEAGRLIQSLFGYHHLTPSLMEALRSNLSFGISGDCFVAKPPRSDTHFFVIARLREAISLFGIIGDCFVAKPPCRDTLFLSLRG